MDWSVNFNYQPLLGTIKIHYILPYGMLSSNLKITKRFPSQLVPEHFLCLGRLLTQPLCRWFKHSPSIGIGAPASLLNIVILSQFFCLLTPSPEIGGGLE
jgi:hypothetical protein